MKRLSNMKISTHLLITLSTMIIFTMLLGALSIVQNNEMFDQTKLIYNHPLVVRRAVGVIEKNIETIRYGKAYLQIIDTDEEIEATFMVMEEADREILRRFEVLKDRYLGPEEDVDNIINAYQDWKIGYEEIKAYILLDQWLEERDNHKDNDLNSDKIKLLIDNIAVINEFAQGKADEILYNSTAINQDVNNQTMVAMIGVLLVSTVMGIILSVRIRKPLEELAQTTYAFQEGDLNARSQYHNTNEIGVLSTAYNGLADTIQAKVELDSKKSQLTDVLLRENEWLSFFRESISMLAELTDSQLAAVYVRKESDNTFDHVCSIGLDEEHMQVVGSELSHGGILGNAMIRRKVEILNDIPEDSKLIYSNVAGDYVPKAIMTIPLMNNGDNSAAIVLGSLSTYDQEIVEFIKDVTDILKVRIQAIMASDTIRSFAEELEQKNHDLDLQKIELGRQTAELTQQNMILEAQKSQLSEVSKLKTNFLSNMSHELRTPLNSVIALSGVLSRRLVDKIPEEEYGYIDVIERNGKNLLSLINDILDISRIESGREEIQISAFKMQDLINDIITNIQPLVRDKKVEIVFDNRGQEALISSDQKKIRHILQNIIGNAVKFTEQGSVKIYLERSAGNVVIKVKDTGIGITEDQLKHIFDEFRQADGGTSRRYGGSGLGLSIAKKYATLLGGSIEVGSIVDRGTTFTITLPMNYSDDEIGDEGALNEFETITKDKLIKPDSELEKLIILVEDSEPAVIQIRELMLELGYNVVVATNGEEALDILDHLMPDAMILDLMMPGINGFQLLETIRQRRSLADLPVLILTAKTITSDEMKKLKSHKVHQLIQKGDIQRVELQNAVTMMLYPEVTESEVVLETVEDDLDEIVGKPSILVVEDNPDNMITVKALLAEDYTIYEAVDGAIGIEKAKTLVPDLIFMDIALPGINGIDAFKQIRSDVKTQHIPIIALTASAMIQDRESILSHGFDAFIAKPIIASEFYRVLGEVLYGK